MHGHERLAAFLSRQRLQQQELARELGCSQPHLSHILHGNRLPGRQLAVRIERFCGIPVAAWEPTRRYSGAA